MGDDAAARTGATRARAARAAGRAHVAAVADRLVVAPAEPARVGAVAPHRATGGSQQARKNGQRSETLDHGDLLSVVAAPLARAAAARWESLRQASSRQGPGPALPSCARKRS